MTSRRTVPVAVRRSIGTASLYAWHDEGRCHDKPDAWIPGGPVAERECLRCPVLERCRDYAARHRWSHVTIAGWTAPLYASYPPWVGT